MGSLSVRVAWEAIRSVDTATLAGSYVKIGAPLIHGAALVKMINNSSVDIFVSTDGVTDMDFCPKGSFFLYDETANASREGGLVVPANSQFFIKGPSGTGLIYLIAQYARG